MNIRKEVEYMKKYTYKGFYGDYGTLIEHNNGKTTLTMHVADKTIKKSYKTLKSAKSALTRFSDCYTLTELEKR